MASVQKRPKLEEDVGQDKICFEHDKLLDIYCHTEQSFICFLCKMDKHKRHKTVPVVSQREEKQTESMKEQRKSQQGMQEMQKKVEELKQAMNIIKLSAQTAVEDSERIFTELISSMEKRRSEVTERIRAQEKAELSRAERLQEQLEQEIADLQRRVTELEQLSHTHDHIHFLREIKALMSGEQSPRAGRATFQSHLCEDSGRITVSNSFAGVRNSLSALKKKLEELCQEEIIRITAHCKRNGPAITVCVASEPEGSVSGSAAAVQIISPFKSNNREGFLYYFRDLTLDPNTVNHKLILSENNRAVMCSERNQQYSDHPERFDSYEQVLSKESVCGRCYWEVKWRSLRSVYISVSYKDISRKGWEDENPFGRNDHSWSLRCSSTSLTFWHNNIDTDLRAPSSFRIGVYVDHSAGTLSFYSISDTMELLHSVHTTFTQPLYAGFRLSHYKSTVRLIKRKKMRIVNFK